MSSEELEGVPVQVDGVMALVESGGFKELLRNREFQLIWGSQIASQLADKFLVYSLLSVTYERSAANTQEAIVLLAYTFPSVLLSPIAGVYADRFDKRRLMMFTNVIRGALILLVPASSLVPYFRGVTWHLLLVTLLFSSVGQFFAPAEASSLPFIMPKRSLVTATSVFTLTIVGTLVVGLPISSVLVRLLGQYAPYFVAAALFGGAAIANISMKTNLSARTTERPHDLGRNWAVRMWSEMTETAAFLRNHRPLLRAFGQLGLAVMLIFSLFTLAQGYMKTELHLDPRDSYLILVPAAAGMGVVAVYLGRGKLAARSGLIGSALVVLGAILILMGTAPALISNLHVRGALIAFAAVAGFFFGGAFGAVFIPAVTLLQESTDPEQRGRTFGAMFTVLNLAIAVPLFIAGLAADTFGLKIVFVLMGLLLASAALLSRPWKPNPIRSTEIDAR
ncbi:MAG TPA: MFS transporter [Candidatus Dormibacteraeota bacterium]|jgi:MFS family permease